MSRWSIDDETPDRDPPAADQRVRWCLRCNGETLRFGDDFCAKCATLIGRDAWRDTVRARVAGSIRAILAGGAR